VLCLLVSASHAIALECLGVTPFVRSLSVPVLRAHGADSSRGQDVQSQPQRQLSALALRRHLVLAAGQL
jgi:hypothetical protein